MLQTQRAGGSENSGCDSQNHVNRITCHPSTPAHMRLCAYFRSPARNLRAARFRCFPLPGIHLHRHSRPLLRPCRHAHPLRIRRKLEPANELCKRGRICAIMRFMRQYALHSPSCGLITSRRTPEDSELCRRCAASLTHDFSMRADYDARVELRQH